MTGMFLNRDGINISKIAIKDAYGNEFSYSYLEKLAEEYRRFIKPRSLVMILCDYEMDTVAFYYCMLANQAVPMLLDVRLDAGMQRRLVQQYQPQYIWKPADGKCRALLQKGRHILAEGNSRGVGMHSDLALLLSTSGSTGSPKFVRLSYDNLIANAKAISAHVGLRTDDTAITTLPFHYCYGLSVMHTHWYMGAAVCVTEWPLTSEKFWDFLEKSKATNFAAVPYQYEILNRIGFANREFHSLRFVTQGGGKLSEKLQDFYGRMMMGKGIRFYILYGQTEGTTVLSGIPCDRVLEKRGSVGIALSGIRAEILPAKEGGAGELVFYGSSVSMGYAEDINDLIKGDENRGILYTGDLAYMDEEQYIYLNGRKRRFVKMLGNRISMDELENILCMRYPGREIVCSGVDNHIIIFYKGEIDEKALITYCEKKCQIKKNMIEVKRLEKIPRNSYGKVIYSELYIGGT